MKISNSKKQLAQIIHENGGWLAGCFAAQQDDGEVWFSERKPVWKTRRGTFDMGYEDHFTIGYLIANRHQTILSRDEYFSLYPAPELVTDTAPEPVVEAKPTIEQLAADYRNLKDYADRKQQEADAAKADAEAKLAGLVAAGKALGLVLSVAGVEPELVITDWRDLRVGDIIWWGGDEDNAPGEYEVEQLEDADYDGYLTIAVGSYWVHYESDEWRFIRRPAQGEADA